METLPEKRRKLPEKIRDNLSKYGLDVQPGDLIISTRSNHSEGCIYRIGKITKDKIEIEHQYDSGEWSPYGDISYKEFKTRFIKLDKPIKELEEETLEFMKSFDGSLDGDKEEVEESTALATKASKEFLLDAERRLSEKINKFALMRSILARKYDMIQSIVQDFEDKLEKVHKVLGVVELYLGIYEEIVQIRQGIPTLPEEPIRIRQQLLFMDEEVGDPKDGGLDIHNIDEFDKWVSEDQNLEKTLPEKKGIVALRVRRYKKEYCEDPFYNFMMNQGNFKTYLLIRNGDNLYRIVSNVTVDPRLFPKKDEFVPKDIELGNGRTYHSPFDEKKIQENIFEYKKYGLMIQGLLHRTQIFQPLSCDINIFNPESWSGMLVFIHDDELTLPTGRLSWEKWQKEINSNIQVGSRILYIADKPYHTDKFMCERVSYGYRFVNPPPTGIYVVIPGPKGETDSDNFRFYYLPSSEVYKPYSDYIGGSWGKDYGYLPRKNRVGFNFYLNEVLNYDQIALDDVEFYVNSRIDREHYIDMIPLLREIRKRRIEEQEYEKQLVSLVAHRQEVKEEIVWKAIEWWKYKNKWKRPISENDSLALKMIERKVKSTLTKESM